MNLIGFSTLQLTPIMCSQAVYASGYIIWDSCYMQTLATYIQSYLHTCGGDSMKGKKINLGRVGIKIFCCLLFYCIYRFFSRWKEAELRQSHAQGFSLDEEQLRQDWAAVVALADQTGKSLEQIHIFVLSHILRRPILVYGVKVVKNFRGENLGFVNFEGLCYLLLCTYVFSVMSS